jgi:hypothetical protein
MGIVRCDTVQKRNFFLIVPRHYSVGGIHYEPKPRDTLCKPNVFNKWQIFVLARIGKTTGFFTKPLPVAVSGSDSEVTYSLRGSWFHILH